MPGPQSLSILAAALDTGSVRVVDLTQTLSEDTPLLVLPEPFGQTAAFSREEISRYDERGVAWHWNNFTVGEHTGTHFDAPIHWVTGKDLADNSQSGDQFFGIHASNDGRVMIFAGGIPLKKDGKVVGAVGVSGGSGDQDHAVAEAGAEAY